MKGGAKMNSVRECPFCGPGRIKLVASDGVMTHCLSCGAEIPAYRWERRYDDWRSDGWPEGDVLIRYEGNVNVGQKHGESRVLLDKNDNITIPKCNCKWKPLPVISHGISERRRCDE